MEYPRKYDIIFHLGLPQEYAYSYSPRRPTFLDRTVGGMHSHGNNFEETDSRGRTVAEG